MKESLEIIAKERERVKEKRERGGRGGVDDEGREKKNMYAYG